MDLKKKAKANASSGFLLFIAKMLITLIMNPLLIHYLGSTHFGVWKSIENFLGFASVADGKATQALKWTIANQESSEDYNKKKRAVGSSIIIWFLFLPILSAIIGLLVHFSPYLIKNLSNDDYMLVKMITLILGVNLIVTPLLAIPESVLIGTNRGMSANYINFIWSLVGAIFIYMVISSGFGIFEISIALLSITLAKGLNMGIVCKKKVNWFSVSKPTFIEISSFFKFSSWVLGWAFISRFLLASEVFLLSILIGPESISQYVFSSYVSMTTIALMAILTASLTPGLGKLIGEGQQYVKVQRVVTQLRDVIFYISLFMGVCILLLNHSFVYLWAGNELYIGIWTNVLIVLLMIQLIIIRNEAFLIDLSLKIKTKVLLGGLSVVTSLILALMGFYIWHDIIGILGGILVGRSILLGIFPILTDKMLKKNKLFHLPYKKIFILLLSFSCAMVVGENQLYITWSQLILFGGLEVLVCIGLLYFLLKQEYKDLIRDKILIKLKNR